MSHTLNLKSGRMILVRLVVGFLILLSGSDQATAQKPSVYITGKDDSPLTKSLQKALKYQIAIQLEKAYPCLNRRILTDDNVADMAELKRLQETLGTPEDRILSSSDLAGATGAQFSVSVAVTQVNSTLTFSVVGSDTRREKVIAKGTATAENPDDALDVADQLAEEFASNMVNSMPDCYENEWIGTITYSRVTQREGRTTEDHLVYKGTKTTEITSKATTDAEFLVRGKKRPARALFVKCSERTVIKIVTDVTITCPGLTPFEEGKTVRWTSTDVEIFTGEVEGKANQAVASVSVDGDQFAIACTVPQIEGGTATRDWSMTHSGGCGAPESQHEVTSITYTTGEEYGNVDGTIDRAQPDILIGRKTFKVPSLEGTQETKIISWNLRFVRSPSTAKGR